MLVLTSSTSVNWDSLWMCTNFRPEKPKVFIVAVVGDFDDFSGLILNFVDLFCCAGCSLPVRGSVCLRDDVRRGSDQKCEGGRGEV
ncbi:unnamed protein product [Meloidogyne enterolobii]|uniref:Uncharacterized protein n=1 Tax=Meloidogyne enterolobii TaxID=390850 RepID=A0ACB0XWV9_MELEN